MSASPKTWLPVIALLGVLAGLAAGALWLPSGSPGRNVATVLWGAIPTAAAIWQFCYHRIERSRLFFDRLRFRAANRESNWSLTASFDVMEVGGAFDAAVAAVAALPAASRLADAAGTTVLQVNGSTVRIAGDTSAGGTGVVRVEFPPAPRQFRAWPDVIGGTVDLVVGAVQDAIPAGRRKFVADVEFPGPNPYFGFFVAHAPLSAVRRFDVELVEPAQVGGDRVLVKDDRIELVTSSMTAVRQLSLKYLALRPVEGT